MSKLKKLVLIGDDLPEGVETAISHIQIAGKKLPKLDNKTPFKTIKAVLVNVACLLGWSAMNYFAFMYLHWFWFGCFVCIEAFIALIGMILTAIILYQHKSDIWTGSDTDVSRLGFIFTFCVFLVYFIGYPLMVFDVRSFTKKVALTSKKIYKKVLGDPRTEFLRSLGEQVKFWDNQAKKINLLVACANHGLIDKSDFNKGIPFGEIGQARDQLLRQIAYADDILENAEIGSQESGGTADDDFAILIEQMERSKAVMNETAGRALAGFEAQMTAKQTAQHLSGPVADLRRAMYPDPDEQE